MDNLLNKRRMEVRNQANSIGFYEDSGYGLGSSYKSKEVILKLYFSYVWLHFENLHT